MSGDMEKYEACPHCGGSFPFGSGWDYDRQRCSRCGLDRLRIKSMASRNSITLQRDRITKLESLCREVVEAKDEYKLFNSIGSYDSAFAAYDRMHDAIDKMRREVE